MLLYFVHYLKCHDRVYRLACRLSIGEGRRGILKRINASSGMSQALSFQICQNVMSNASVEQLNISFQKSSVVFIFSRGIRDEWDISIPYWTPLSKIKFHAAFFYPDIASKYHELPWWIGPTYRMVLGWSLGSAWRFHYANRWVTRNNFCSKHFLPKCIPCQIFKKHHSFFGGGGRATLTPSLP